MSDQIVGVPKEVFDQIAAAPLRLAQIEAADMMRRGDTAGANARIAAGVAQSAAIHAQAAASAPPAPAAPAPAPPPPPAPRNLSEAFIARYRQQQALLPSGDPRQDMSLPFGLPGRR
jgi:hypothetical protein